MAIGPDHPGNLLEIIWLELADGVELVIHAMPLRPIFYDLPQKTGRTSMNEPKTRRFLEVA